MTLLLTKKEWDYIIIDSQESYAFKCDKNAPSKEKKKIERQLEAHKRWLSENDGD